MRTNKVIGSALLGLALGLGLATPAIAAPPEDPDGWKLFGRALMLMQQFTHMAAESPDPKAAEKKVDAMLAGQNPEANRLANSLFDEILQDAPAEYKGTLTAIGRDLATVARRERERNAQLGISAMDPASTERTLQARKDLQAIGLSYHNVAHFHDAVKRDDLLAVELFVHGRGVNLSAIDAKGRSALDIAKQNGNKQMIGLLNAAGGK